MLILVRNQKRAPLIGTRLTARTDDTIPTGLTKNVGDTGGTVTSSLGHSQSKSMLFSFNVSDAVHEQFERNIFDFGTGVTKAYISVWIYLDKTGSTTSTKWQWKGIRLSSEPYGYTSSDPEACCALNNNWWYVSGVAGSPRWGNTAWMFYYNGTSNSGYSDGLRSDAYLWGEWQRIEIQLGASTAANSVDATFYSNRVGRSGGALTDGTGTSIGTDDRQWRYVSLGQAVASVYDGVVIMKVYYDDLYIDRTLATSRVW